MSKKTTVSLGNALDIMHASGLKTRLTTALAKNMPVVLISDKIEKADTAGLQLIYAFIKKVEHNGHSITWQKPSATLYQACELLGMSQAIKLVDKVD